MGRTVSEERRTCIFPGCDRRVEPPHPFGGPPSAFCDLEEHNALRAHQERQRLESKGEGARDDDDGGGSMMADQAYRAVFLRVHPTGKMVLSLTTEADGREADYAELVAAELGVPALDVKVVPADTDRFGEGHGYNTAPSQGAAAAIGTATGRIREKARLLAGAALETDPASLAWTNGAWVAGDGSDPERTKTIEDLAMYAHGTGPLPPGVEGGLDAQAVYRD
jgi:aerobic carbon-monoxide dehydrogenase large subunit